jgi:hypothetical protein
MMGRLLENSQVCRQLLGAIAWRPLSNEKNYQKNRLDIRRSPQVEVACEAEMVSPRHRKEAKAHRERNTAKGM